MDHKEALNKNVKILYSPFLIDLQKKEKKIIQLFFCISLVMENRIRRGKKRFR
jgi:hypothetical protein